MTSYEENMFREVEAWKVRMQRSPSFTGMLSKKLQQRINKAIPDKVHKAMTTAIKQMTQTVCFGAEFTTPEPFVHASIEQREAKVRQRINFYRKTAAAEGAVTGAAGFFIGLADFPLWLTLKIKMLFEIAALYGYHVGGYKERIFVLYIFELTFSSQVNRQRIFQVIGDWDNYQRSLPEDIRNFDWRSFQQEYRDYIDIAKLLQLVPGIGAAVGALVNYRLTGKLGDFAMNCYRMRGFMLNKPGALPGRPAIFNDQGAVE
jgi:hypothetical protein